MEALAQVQEFATFGVGEAWLLLGNFLALLILTLLVLGFAMRGGRNALISLILALYAGYALYIVFPYTASVVGAGEGPMLQAILSIIVFVLATLPPFVLVRRLTGGGFGSLSLVPNLILSLLTAGFLLALGYHVFDVSNIYSFPEPLAQLFAPKGCFFYWFIAPLVGLFVLAR